MSGVDNEVLSLDDKALTAGGQRCSILCLRSLGTIFTLQCCDRCRIHDPSLRRSPHPRPDGERTAPPLKHPLTDGTVGVGCWGLICCVSPGDTVSMVRGVTCGVYMGKGGHLRKVSDACTIQ